MNCFSGPLILTMLGALLVVMQAKATTLPPASATSSSPLTWNTFLGGISRGIAVDTNGNVYVSGTSCVTWGTPIRAFKGEGTEAYVAKFDTNGALVWNTFLGATGDISHDYGYGIAVDANGDVYVSGVSRATWGTPIRAFKGEGTEAYVAKLDTNGTLVWTTFLGGTGDDGGYGIAADANGTVYVTGTSAVTWGAPIRAFQGLDFNAFVAKLDADGALAWHTFLGGTECDNGYDIEFDANGAVYASGDSSGTWGTPIRAFQGGGKDAFVAKLDTSGALVWNTFLGGTGHDYGLTIAVDPNGNVSAAGDSWSTWGTPIRAFQGEQFVTVDTFVAKLDTEGALAWNTFLGGTSDDHGNGIAADANGTVYVAGDSTATWGSPFLAYHEGHTDAFAAKLDSNGALEWNTFLGGTAYDSGEDIVVDANGNVYVTGISDTTWGNPIRAILEGDFNGFVAVIAVHSTSLTVHSTNPPSDVVFAVSPSDMSGQGDGSTPFARSYLIGASVTLTAPATAGGNTFRRWYGCTNSSGATCSITLDTDRTVTANYAAPGASDNLARNDFDGDGISDMTVYWQAAGDWYVTYSGGDYLLGYTMGWSEAAPVPGDYDGDGITDLAVYHQAAGNWYINYSSGGYLLGYNMGWSEAIPVPGDYDGDGKTDMAVYHQAAGNWYINYSGGGYLLGYNMGWSEAIPVPGDYDGDGKTDLAVYHQAAGDWYINYSSGGYLLGYNMGWSEAVPVPGDYDGDTRTDMAVYHQAAGDWYINYSSGGYLLDYNMGWSEAVPVPGDYDGDGKTDMAIYHQAAGDWYINYSSGGYLLDYNMGWSEAYPVGGY